MLKACKLAIWKPIATVGSHGSPEVWEYDWNAFGSKKTYLPSNREIIQCQPSGDARAKSNQ
jgi:hypothetical protein